MQQSLFSSIFLSLFLSFILTPASAQEGMWLPQLVAKVNGTEMHEMGMRMSADDIYSVNEGSLKDAIALFGGFCTSSVISPHGLLLTNHHCGYSTIQSHSSVDNNLLNDGYWASSLEEELAGPELSATFVERIDEVTEPVLSGIDEGMTNEERQSRLDRNKNAILDSIDLDEHQEAKIQSFYHGNQYFLTVSVTYPDVRLVGAPPESIGKFGADTDNWEWPRHTGDFALFRIYADSNNLPAEYSENNIPYKPDHYLPISLDGRFEGDFNMIFGFPGRTDEYLPAIAVEQLVKTRNPARIAIRDKALEIMDRAIKSSEEIEIKYASKYASLSNYWKKWIGENEGIEASHALDSIRAREDSFEYVISRRANWSRRYGHILGRYEQLYREMKPLAVYRDYHREITGRIVELLRYSSLMGRLVKIYDNSGPEAFAQYRPRFEQYFSEQMENYLPSVDRKIFEPLVKMYIDDLEIEGILKGRTVEDWADTIYNSSLMTRPDSLIAWFDRDPEAAVERLRADPGIRFAGRLNEAFQSEVAPRLEEIQKELNRLDRQYMDGLKTVFPEASFYPDANSTLRISYGQVEGYSPRAGIRYLPRTYLKGVMAKHVPGDHEFDVPDKLIELFENKEYGKYGTHEGMPVCYLGTNHTTGGNSGSPAIDAYGNLVGLNFDRVWHGTMSDYYYDKDRCRNIMVDVRYILFIIDKFAEADYLLEEMRLVRPGME